jgi:hypothetical protein
VAECRTTTYEYGDHLAGIGYLQRRSEAVNERKAAAFRQGIYVVIVLAVLSAIEFGISIALDGPAVPLLLIALIKAALIVYFFMHIYRLWREERH